MNIVIPMAGRGSRLAGHLSGLPKPLIEVAGRPLWEWATRCLPIDSAVQVIFVILREHEESYGLSKRLKSAFPTSQVEAVVLDGVTDGQLCTVVQSKHLLHGEDSLVIFNADTWFRHDVGDFLKAADSFAGVLGVAERPGDQWSFVRTSATGEVVEVAEKHRISGLACTGLYHFASASQFMEDARTMLAARRSINGEYFVAPVYQLMIDRGECLGTVRAAEFFPIGTPEELVKFETRIAEPARNGVE